MLCSFFSYGHDNHQCAFLIRFVNKKIRRMSSNKRGSNQKKTKNEEPSKVSVEENATPTEILFKSFQVELDAKYDKHERLVKKSRDLTIESKRIIFLLHRVTSSEDDKDSNNDYLEEAKIRIAVLFKTLVHDIALELNKREVYQFIRAFTGGLQEFIEAVSFYYYLRHGSVICLEEVHKQKFLDQTEGHEDEVKSGLPFSDLLTPVDYVLGIADLTGELMRKCINSVAAGDMEEPFKLGDLLQHIYECMLGIHSYSRDLKRKLFTLRSSLVKVENACYAIRIRGTEFPEHIIPDLFASEVPEDVEI